MDNQGKAREDIANLGRDAANASLQGDVARIDADEKQADAIADKAGISRDEENDIAMNAGVDVLLGTGVDGVDGGDNSDLNDA